MRLKEVVRTLQKLQQNFFICANSFVQWAGVAALRKAEPETLRMKAMYNERRKQLIQGLRDIGFGVAVEPTGAFYVFANAQKFGSDSYKLAFNILRTGEGGCHSRY